MSPRADARRGTRPPAAATDAFDAELERLRRLTGLQVDTLARAVQGLGDIEGWARLTALGTRATVDAQHGAVAATTRYLEATLDAAGVPSAGVSVPIQPGLTVSGRPVSGMFAATQDVVRNRMAGGDTFEDALDHSAHYLVGQASSEPHRIGRDGQLAVGLTDERFGRFRRVAEPGACPWCRMLATRGAVFLTAETAGQHRKYHPHDRCRVELVVSAAAIAKSKSLSKDWGAAIRDEERMRQAGAMQPSSVPGPPIPVPGPHTAARLNVPVQELDDLAEFPRILALQDAGPIRLERTAKAAGFDSWEEMAKVKASDLVRAEKKANRTFYALQSHEVRYPTPTSTQAARRVALRDASEAAYTERTRFERARRLVPQEQDIATGRDLPDAADRYFLPSRAEIDAVMVRRLKAVTVTLDGDAMTEGTRAALRAVEDLPAGHLEVMVDQGGTVHIVQGRLSSHPRWQGTKATTAADARASWDGVAGVADLTDEAMYIATDLMADYTLNGSSDIVRHEFAHVVDALMGSPSAKDPRFRQAYSARSWRNPYFDEAIQTSGGMEAWAEGYASHAWSSPGRRIGTAAEDFQSVAGNAISDVVMRLVNEWVAAGGII